MSAVAVSLFWGYEGWVLTRQLTDTPICGVHALACWWLLAGTPECQPVRKGLAAPVLLLEMPTASAQQAAGCLGGVEASPADATSPAPRCPPACPRSLQIAVAHTILKSGKFVDVALMRTTS